MATAPAAPDPVARSRRYLLLYAALLCLMLAQFAADGDVSFGRRPWENLQRTAIELSWPSFLNVWFGNEALEFRKIGRAHV